MLKIVSQNLQKGAGKRWPELAERIAACQPDVVMLCECNGWNERYQSQLLDSARDLGLRPAPLTPSGSGFHTAVLFGDRLALDGIFAGQARMTYHGFAVVGLVVSGVPMPIAFVSTHLTPYSAEAAIIEAGIIASNAYRFGPYAVIAGDINYPAWHPDNPKPAFETMRPYNIGSRTLLPANPGDDPWRARIPDRRVAAKITHKGFVDVAWDLYERSARKDESLLARTAHDDRIDQAYVSAALRAAIAEYRVLADPAEASDHHGIYFALDVALVDSSQKAQWQCI
jgi:endonuclease/exonuclease/phosphatase family metal-dependent hydrolase